MPSQPALRRPVSLRWFVLLGALVALLLPAGSAWARGTVKLDATTVQEADGRWRLKFTIDYGSIPTVPMIPVVLAFKPVVLYERALTDESPKNPVVTKKPLQNQPENTVPTDIGFSDPASGKVFKLTKFTIDLKRKNDFEAGEYELVVRTAEGETLGGRIRVVLNGDNPVVDRRAITFVADDRPKPAASGSAAASANKYDPANDPEPGAIPDDVPPPPAAPPPVDPGAKKGCGCRLVAAGESELAGALGLALGAAALAARRRRAERPRTSVSR
ncbi:MAG: hypothetical protein IT373_14720 [Polyangiaceae bacterium]|nr:hypothetical protein [Polyangiaceae bacterium]